MRSNEVFAAMTPEEAQDFLEEVRKDAPRVAQVALHAAAEAFKLRPQFMRRQPPAKQADWMRRALGRTMMAAVAEEVLAEYFLEHRSDLLVEWLDLLGLEHEDGVLEGTPAVPDKAEIERLVAEYRKGDDKKRRELLLVAFAAQSSIDWPDLEAQLTPS